jgi:hypothetical protein
LVVQKAKSTISVQAGVRVGVSGQSAADPYCVPSRQRHNSRPQCPETLAARQNYTTPLYGGIVRILGVFFS